MHNIYSICLISVLTVGYAHVKAFPADVQCGTVSRRKGKIINGDVAGASQIPWIASIKRNGTHNCGGTIISSRFLISAGHCFNDLRDKGQNILDASNTPILSQWTVTLGDFSQRVEEEHSRNVAIKTLIFHKDYKRYPLVNDIVLLELNKEIEWEDHIMPICLPMEDIKESGRAVAAGWGHDIMPNTSAEDNSKLRFVELTIFENDKCNSIYTSKSLGLQLERTQMCAGRINEIRDTTEGDSGGPLLVFNGGREVLVGVTSAGTRESIFPKAPGIYTRVYEYLDWINMHTQGSKKYFVTLHQHQLS